ncbi:MAG: hypothetical protein M3N82_02565, partial [Pseudomonadota bacterium]|nr:hypothetical protein [Pseudomonadota bacterium]
MTTVPSNKVTASIAGTLTPDQVQTAIQQSQQIGAAATANSLGASNQFVFFAGFDGTNNDAAHLSLSGNPLPTNVRDLVDQVRQANPPDGSVVAGYYPGVGTPGTPFGSSAFPTTGEVQIATKAYNDFASAAEAWIKAGNSPDSVTAAFTSFSRGYGSAAVFSQMIYEKGLVLQDGTLVVPPGHVGVSAGVVFDPVNTGMSRNDSFAPDIQNVVVVQAGNEYRYAFKAEDLSQVPGVSVVSMYGNHCNIGGGYDNGLGALSLQGATDFLEKSGLNIAPVATTKQFNPNQPVNVYDEGVDIWGHVDWSTYGSWDGQSPRLFNTTGKPWVDTTVDGVTTRTMQMYDGSTVTRTVPTPQNGIAGFNNSPEITYNADGTVASRAFVVAADNSGLGLHAGDVVHGDYLGGQLVGQTFEHGDATTETWQIVKGSDGSTQVHYVKTDASDNVLMDVTSSGVAFHNYSDGQLPTPVPGTKFVVGGIQYSVDPNGQWLPVTGQSAPLDPRLFGDNGGDAATLLASSSPGATDGALTGGTFLKTSFEGDLGGLGKQLGFDPTASKTDLINSLNAQGFTVRIDGDGLSASRVSASGVDTVNISAGSMTYSVGASWGQVQIGATQPDGSSLVNVSSGDATGSSAAVYRFDGTNSVLQNQIVAKADGDYVQTGYDNGVATSVTSLVTDAAGSQTLGTFKGDGQTPVSLVVQDPQGNVVRSDFTDGQLAQTTSVSTDASGVSTTVVKGAGGAIQTQTVTQPDSSYVVSQYDTQQRLADQTSVKVNGDYVDTTFVNGVASAVSSATTKADGTKTYQDLEGNGVTLVKSTIVQPNGTTLVSDYQGGFLTQMTISGTDPTTKLYTVTVTNEHSVLLNKTVFNTDGSTTLTSYPVASDPNQLTTTVRDSEGALISTRTQTPATDDNNQTIANSYAVATFDGSNNPIATGVVQYDPVTKTYSDYQVSAATADHPNGVSS